MDNFFTFEKVLYFKGKGGRDPISNVILIKINLLEQFKIS